MRMTSTAGKIVNAARELVEAEGASGVTMRKVAAAVGVTPMAIYRHYPNREALLAAVAEAVFVDLAGHWGKRTWPEDADLQTHVHGVVGDHLDFALGSPRLYAFLFTERREHARSFPDDFRAGRSPTLNLLAQTLSEAVRRGALRECDVWELALVLAATMHGLVQMYHGGRIDMAEPSFRVLCESAMWRVLDGVRATTP